MRGLGTLLNIATVALGTTLGVLLGSRFPDRIRKTVMQGLGLFVAFLGLSEATKTDNPLLLLAALPVGGLLGELARLEERLESLGAWIQRRAGVASDPSESGRSTFVEGFLVASLVFCVGPLTILGSIQDGLEGNIDLLATKAVLDGFAALAFASTLGWGVGASIVTIAVFQGGLTAGAVLMDDVLTDRMVDEMSAVGGLMLLGIALRLLDLAEVRVASFLPGLVLAPVFVAVFGR